MNSRNGGDEHAKCLGRSVATPLVVASPTGQYRRRSTFGCFLLDSLGENLYLTPKELRKANGQRSGVDAWNARPAHPEVCFLGRAAWIQCLASNWTDFEWFP